MSPTSLYTIPHAPLLLAHPLRLRTIRLDRTSHIPTRSSSGSAENPLSGGQSGKKPREVVVSPEVSLKESEEVEKPTLWRRFRNIFLGGNLDKARLKALGIGAFLSYGFVSNLSYGTCVAVAWITHVKRTGLSPLAPGQWGGFLAVYAGLFALQNFLRPLRFTLAVALTPAVNRLMEYVQGRLNVNKGQAFGFLMLVLGVSTTALLGFALWILGGFPPTPATS